VNNVPIGCNGKSREGVLVADGEIACQERISLFLAPGILAMSLRSLQSNRGGTLPLKDVATPKVSSIKLLRIDAIELARALG